jgi:hypothetical protein
MARGSVDGGGEWGAVSPASKRGSAMGTRPSGGAEGLLSSSAARPLTAAAGATLSVRGSGTSLLSPLFFRNGATLVCFFALKLALFGLVGSPLLFSLLFRGKENLCACGVRLAITLEDGNDSVALSSLSNLSFVDLVAGLCGRGQHPHAERRSKHATHA